MAIPISDDLKQIQAPRTANLTAPDAASNSKLFLQGQQQLSSALGQMGEAAIGAGQRYERTQDAFKRNEAERIYNREFTYWNEWLKEKQGLERIEAQKKYEAEMNRAKDEYEARINKVRDFEMREGSKQSVNQLNIRNAANYQYENYKNESAIQESSMQQSVLSAGRAALSQIKPTTTAEQAMKIAEEQFESITSKITDFYSGRMGEPDAIVAQRIKDVQGKMLISLADYLNKQTMELGAGNGYNYGTMLIKEGIARNLINIEEGKQMLHDIELERLSAMFTQNPAQFDKGGGVFDLQKARRLGFENLKEEEMLKTFKNLSSANKGAGEYDKQVANYIGIRMVDEFQNGLLSEGFYNVLTESFQNNNLPSDDEKRQAQDNQKVAQNKKDVYFSNLVKNIMVAEDLINGKIAIDPTIDGGGEGLKASELQQGKAKNRMLLSNPQVQNLLNIKSRLVAEIAKFWNPANGTWNTRPDELFGKATIIDRETAMTLNALANSFREQDNRIKEQYGASLFRDNPKFKPRYTPTDVTTIMSNMKFAQSMASKFARENNNGTLTNIDWNKKSFGKSDTSMVTLLDAKGQPTEESVPLNDLTATLYAHIRLSSDGTAYLEGIDFNNLAQQVRGFKHNIWDDFEGDYSAEDSKILSSAIQESQELSRQTDEQLESSVNYLQFGGIAYEVNQKRKEHIESLQNDPEYREEFIEKKKFPVIAKEMREQSKRDFLDLSFAAANMIDLTDNSKSAEDIVSIGLAENIDDATEKQNNALLLKRFIQQTNAYRLLPNSNYKDLVKDNISVIRLNNQQDIDNVVAVSGLTKSKDGVAFSPIDISDILKRNRILDSVDTGKLGKNAAQPRKEYIMLCTDAGSSYLFKKTKYAKEQKEYYGDYYEFVPRGFFQGNASQVYSMLMIDKDVLGANTLRRIGWKPSTPVVNEYATQMNNLYNSTDPNYEGYRLSLGRNFNNITTFSKDF